MDTGIIEHRIKLLAGSTDSLISRLDTLSGRIDTARSNENQELTEYYERQFAEASVEFMNGVETILDEWYALKGIKRPPSDEEIIEPEILDEIHNTVVSIVQGLPLSAGAATKLLEENASLAPSQPEIIVDAEFALEEGTAPQASDAPKAPKASGGKVDVKG
ncbi:MAG: hypothetical protein LBT31_04350 [Synergistaceae bacterium]|jgi:hypothetical protein|nr:hypothetical protein [Synergistaceae bacterium]